MTLEPPDIGNWFSSYVYESPVLFTDGELEVPFVKEIQFGDCDGSAVKRSRRKANWDISNSFGTSDKTSIHHTDVFRDMMSSHSHIESDTSQVLWLLVCIIQMPRSFSHFVLVCPQNADLCF